ncbi:glycoside hydrolase family 2 TIM barrel-domain containing protein [uncultured Bacteroides sp.]|uniref:glycoside hydrolase family 2 TIM barrel-domain containing protein n=1 Tax=uncultured Bacteroides sp. TaxID=162156 RepID=UPI0026757FAB|nr:glycoside hydrolase family 2 TIM barrel-domain containing protein [uncultured Bacteroides sp.]
MNRHFESSVRKLAVSTLLLGFIAGGSASERKTCMNGNWKFHRGCIANAEQASFDDTRWRTLDLPHDWSMEPVPVQREGITTGPFSRMSIGGPDTGQTVGGEGWYRKEFVVGPEDAGKIISLYFEGAYNQAEVWINGRKACFNPYGYIPFKIDVNPYCNAPGIPNTIAVKVINEGLNSRWYAGSGIYRHVWMVKTDKVYLDEWDTFVDASEVKGKKATVRLHTILHNSGGEKAAGDLHIRILSPQGKEVCSATRPISAAGKSDIPLSFTFDIGKPELWSVDTPSLYTACLSVKSGGLSDEITVPFGIRTIEFSAEKGFLLNGKPLKLKGGCLHHDNGLLGAVAIDRAEERKVELMKANGFNAVRCSHNLPSEYFLQACDRLGLLVIDEVFDQWQQAKRPQDYHRFFDEWSEHDLSVMIRRDRNHPSIIMWSIGNEIAERADEPAGEAIAKRLVATIRKYDTSRAITAAVNSFWDRRHFSWEKDSERAFRNLDVSGYNYQWKEYEKDHERFPQRIMYGSESVPKEAAQNWNLIDKNPYLIGDFVWTALDYLGEAGLAHTLELAPGEQSPQFMGWPWYNAWCGDIDLCGDKKPQSYYRDILWKRREISLAVQPPVAEGKREDVNFWGWRNELLSWNWKGMEGRPMTVRVYSRSPKVRLYLNNRLIGEKETAPDTYTATFTVPYEPGQLKAVNMKSKKEAASTELNTAGSPASIRLTADRLEIKADKNDLAYVKIEILDKDGNPVPDCDIPVHIKCSGKGSIIASGNGSADDMESFRSLNPRVFRGKAIVILQPETESGIIRLTVSAQGLPDASVSITAH